MADESARVTSLPADKLRRLMARLTERQGTAAWIPRLPRDGALPLSFAQERVWFLDRLGAGGAAYHIPAAVRLRGPLDAIALEKALAAVIRRHEALRTTFGEQDGRPVQTVHAEACMEMPRVDLAALQEALRESELARVSREEAGRPFDLARGPLLRTVLVRTGTGDHVLVLAFHHIITDGWSLGVLLREVAALYPGAPAVLPDLPIQPADYAVWERERLHSEALEGEIAFWRKSLAGLPPLELPADRPRPASPSLRGCLATLSLPGETARALEALARRESATPFMVLLALFQALLLRSTGQSDFGVGTPVANRTRSEVEGLIGLFVNTLVLRADLSGEPGFAELVRRAREVTLAAFAHQELPFEKLVEELRPEREPGRNPLFQVLFTLQDQPWPKLRIGEVDLEMSEIDTATARTDLTLIWRERDGIYEAVLEYSTDLFDEVTARRLLRWTTLLLGAAVEDPEVGVRELPLLDAAERAALLEGGLGLRTSYPREATIHGLVGEQVRRNPTAIAVEMGGERSTYAELADRAHCLARRLLSLGVRPDDRVGLAVERSTDLVAGMLGILSAGGAYVPLDLSYPQERLDWMIDDAGVKALVHNGGWQGSPAVPLVSLGDATLSTEAPTAVSVTADHLAYVIYTSGSTGRPKGVAVPHRAVVRLLVETDYVRLEPSDRVAQVSNPAFDAATFEVWGALFAGARLIGVPREEALSPEALARRLAGDGITTLFLTTALFNQVARHAPGAFGSLRHLLFGGEAVDPGAVQQVLAQGRPERLLHVYGPTETTTFATWHEVKELPAQAATVPIGRPLANSTAWVVDPVFGLSPAGVPGELLLGGDGLARGYHERAELTAERFVPHPWSDRPGDRLYRTGDLVRRLEGSGEIEFLGRIDQQVKIRGLRIEPGEIEAVLATHPDVAACAVVVLGSSGEDRRLAAWLAPREGAAPEPAALRSWLAARLPAYMVPAAFGVLDTLPLTPNGKVDRRALARLLQPSAEARGAEPETPLERRIAAVWSDLLGRERIGRDDDFFALGGHSLLATRVVSRLREEIGVELPLLEVFENPTLAGLAAAVEREAGGTPVLEEWSSTGWKTPVTALIHELFEEQVARTPGKTAAICQSTDVTYRELAERAGQLARLILSFENRGLVGLMATPDLPLLVGMLGILKAGNGFVPLDPDLPAERLQRMVEDCGLTVLATDRKNLVKCPAVAHVVCLDDLDPALEPLSSGTTRAGDGTAYVIFTSGSTGVPKGVPITHENLVPLLLWSREVFGFGEHTRVLQSLSYAFDFGVFEILTTLLFGGTIVLRGDAERSDIEGYLQEVRHHGINTLHTTPSFFRAVAAAAGERLPLQVLHLGGEALSEALVAEAFAVTGPECRVFNGYGPTEAAVNCALYEVGRAADWRPRGLASIPIGRPSAENRLYVLDSRLQPVPHGEAGELLVGGVALSRGYLGRPDLTAARFIPDPFGESGGRLYRTGDLVRFHPDGAIEFLGRIDHQVKIRGYRIELQEIEAALAAHPEVGTCAVVALPQDGGEARLAAFVAARQQPPEAAELRLFLSRTLPAYMVPASFAFLAELPLNASGKVDRKALALLQPPSAEARGAEPETPLERRIAAIWSDLLRQPWIGRDDDFFTLGGHSLLATRVVSRLRQELSIELPVISLFENPTLAGLAAAVEREGKALPDCDLLLATASETAPPLSFTQERLWFLDQLRPGSAAYNIPAAVRLTGRLDPAVLTACFGEIVCRHATLRTTFLVDTSGEPRQQVAPAAEVRLPLVDLAALPEEARRLAAAEAAAPFDLAAGPLLRTTLLRLGEDEHLLLLTVHHIVADGWSIAILVRETAALYEAFAAGRPSPLPDLPIQYADFALWQRRRLSGERLESELRFWRGRLQGAPPELALPTDRARPARASERGTSCRIRLSSELAEGVRRLALCAGATPFMVLLAAFETLLSRLSGQTDLTIGTPVAGRQRAEVEDLIGFFVNTLVLRADLSDAPCFDGLLARTRRHALEAFAHQEIPFEKLVEQLQPGRDLGRTPLFQAFFALQNAPVEPLRLPGLAVELLPERTGTAKFDLTLALGEDGDGFVGELIGSADLLEEATIRRWAGCFERLLAAVLEVSGGSVFELPLLGEAESRTILGQWSSAGWQTPAPVPVHELFAEQAARTPGRPAVVCRGEALSYRELDERAGRLARRLAGLGDHGLVGLMATPDLALPVGMLGILKAGRGFVPLAPDLPAERLERMAAQCGLAVLAADRRSLARARKVAAGAHVVCLDDELETRPPATAGTGDGTAYVIFTSGSTGVPKGVPITHENLLPFLLWSREVFGFGEHTRVLQSLSYTFDFGVFEILSTLLFGGTLVLRGDAERSDIEDYLREVREHAVNTLHTTPSFFRAVAASAGAEGLPTIEVLHLGGEALTEALVEEAFRVTGPQCRLFNGYGPTEAAVNCALYEIGRAADWRPRGLASLPIGYPSAANRLYVLDRRMQPVPVGVHGELLVGGVTLSRGYLGRPDLTAARFVSDPSGEPGGRLYRTGDLVRFLADGAIEFLGRVDHQVKVRGYRIELEEIEAALAQHPEVGACAVLAVRPDSGEARLAAWVAPRRETLEAAELRRFLGRTLPPYMVPASFSFLPDLPLSTSGKVDRKALALLPAGGTTTRGSEPATALERRIAAVWSELLGRERIDRDDDFFALGGHSLLATRVVSRLRAELGVELPVLALFEAPTLAGLAAAVEEARAAALDSEPIVAAASLDEAPLSFAQERLWFLEQLRPGTSTYNIPAAVQVCGRLDRAVLAAGLGEIVRRHATLRTIFPEAGGKPRQQVAPPAAVDLPLVDLAALQEEARDRESRRLAAAEAAAPFDLAAGPLLRTTLLRLGADEHLLLLTLHHIIADGWSVGLLIREMGMLSEVFAAGRPTPLPELPVQYADFAHWQRRRLDGATLDAELGFWSERLRDAPADLALPTDRPRPAVLSGRGASRRLRLPAELTEGVHALALRSGTTHFMVLLAAFEALLSRLSGQPDLTIGTPVAGRQRAEVEDLIGFFVNTLVLRADLADAPSFEVLLARTRRHALEAYAHQELPFEKLVEHLQPERSLGHNPLFQVLFSLQNQPWPELRLAGLSLSPVEVDGGTAKADLSLVWREAEGAYEAVLEYSTDLFEGATAERLLLWGARLLGSVLEHPAACVTELPLLDAAEQAALLDLYRPPIGKVDRRAHPRAPAADARAAAPETSVELRIAAVWSDLLRQPRIGREDSFFELGGHSLLATQVVSRLRDQLGTEIPVRVLFEEPTLAGLARWIEAALQAERPEAVRLAAPVLRRAERHERLPLSFAQERLWFLEQLEPGSAFYNIPLASLLTGPLQVGALQQGIAELVRRHESLRTTFGDEQGRPFQVIAATASAEVPLVDLSGLPEPLRDREMRRRVAEEACRPFDLARGPLFRIPLFRLGPEEHALVPTMHHIISDGWSMTVLLREIAALYDAFSAGRTPSLPELPVQYADYAVWQRGHLQGETLEARLAWWRERLTGVSGLQLPTDRPRPPVETFRGRQRLVALSAGLTRRLHELSTREGVTLFMALLAAFQTLLLRVTGQTDLPVGSPIANRYRSEIEGVIGFFANTVVLRTDLSGNPSFRELLRRVREVTLGAYAHEDLPFEKLVEEIQPERDMSRNPLFQVMCVLQNQPWPEAPMGEVEITSLPVDSGTAKFDLTLFWREDAGILAGMLEHNTDLFDDTTAWRLYRHHEALLRAALDDPEERIGALPLLDAAERHQILQEWNAGSGDGMWAGRCVHQWVEEQVARTPGALAVIDGDRKLTYAELDARANRLARGLARRGVRPEALAGICVERSLEMVVAALAVLKAGGALVALDPAYPRERLATIIDDARLAVLLTQAPLLQHFPQHQGIAFCIEHGDDPFPEESTESPSVAVDPDHPIYAIYTSGSTGQPKGIVVTHRAFSNLLAWQLGDPGLRPGGRTVQFATFGFCVSFQEMLSSWCSGGTLVLADEMTRRDLAGLALFLEEQEIDRLHLPFAALKHLAEAAVGQRLPARLRTVITAGEQLQVTPAVRSLFERLPGCTLSNQYGASETHVVTALTLCGDPAGWPAIPPVGRPVDNVGIHLLDAGLEPVPIGVAGELYAGGACAPRCYLNDPVLTASKLVPDPFGGVPGARLYRTGDAARYLADGRIEYHGRIDTQVKIRGFRVELGEIETVLARHPGVRDAAVVARPGHDGQRLVAYVVPAGESGSLFDELRTLLKQKLPDHMVPSAFVEMPALPVNANGKLDQAALPEPEAGTGLEQDYVGPRTPIEELISGIWAEVLGLERVGVCSDFFDLGGHSLLATQVVARVRQTLGVDLGVRALFEAPTVAGLTLAVAEALLDSADIPHEYMARVPRDEPLVLSFAQQRLWFLDQLDPGNPVYNLPATIELVGRLDVPALAATFTEVVRRHEALRTTYSTTAGEPVQVIAEPAAFALLLIDLQGLPRPEDIAGESRRLADAEARRPFDLGDPQGGPMLRATLLRTGAERHIVLVTMHHIASDGWSLGVLVREVGALYAAFAAGRPSPLPELSVQYADFAAWQRRHLSGERLEVEIAWWRGRLAGMPPVLDLATDHPRQAALSGRGALHTFLIDREGSAGVTALSRRHGATLFMTLLAGFAGLLGRYAGQDDLAVGTPLAGRTQVETEPLIGFFVNALVLRMDLSGDPGFAELLGRVREATLSAYAHQDIPFERLVEELAPERDLSRPPLVQVLFALQNTPAGRLDLPGLALSVSGTDTGAARVELTCTLTETERGLRGNLEYSRDLFERPTIERLAGHLARLLAGAVADPQRRLSELPLLSTVESAQLLEWRGEVTAYPREATVHALFAGQAALRPDAVALAGAGESLTYGELRRQAGRLACRLQAVGVGPEVRVGLCLDRSPVRVVATLAVLETGAAYVPLDPSHPRERLAALIDDSAASVLVTEKRWAAGLPPTAAKVLCLDREETLEEPASWPSGLPEVPQSALAYVMYTSGSTGEPKGVAVPHRAVVRLVRETNYARFGPDEVFLQLAPYAFDASTLELWGALLHGGRLVVPPPGVLPPAELGELLQEHGVTTLWLTAGLFHQMVEDNLPGLAGVRQLLAGGDVLSPEHVRRAVAELPGTRLINGYGPTENTTFTCCHPVVGLEGARPSVPLGRPIANTWVAVLDRHLGPVPVGVAGELCTGGDGLARGYLGQPDWTAERFVPDSFGDLRGEAGGRLYRTGDRARYLPDGCIEFLGRFDAQVKIRGFRIEPGEIEAALARCPGVREAVVMARSGRDGHRLVAYVVPASAALEGAGSLIDELRTQLRQKLPEHMIPSVFVEMPYLPLNANGKLDRAALPEPEAALAREEYVAPRTPIEELIAGIWAEVLGLERVGVASDFFALGGHSLLATRMVTRLCQALGVDLSVRDVFEARTVEELTITVAEMLLDLADNETVLEAIAAAGEEPVAAMASGGIEGA